MMKQKDAYKVLLPYNLQYFADGPGGEKTEKATPRKKKKAREEGQVVKSTEVSTAVLLIALFVALQFLVPNMAEKFISIFKETYTGFSQFSSKVLVLDEIDEFLLNIFIQFIWIIAPILAISFAAGLAVSFAQVGWNLTGKPLMPKFNRLSPVSGFKRLFSMQAVMNLVKSLLKIAIILVIAYNTLKGKEKALLLLYNMSFYEAVTWIGYTVLDVGLKISIYFIFIAGIDYLFQFFKHNKDLKMTKQEIKDEYKSTEGNPEIKGKIKQKMREMSLRRMMQEIPKADVVITNPTHFAVAIMYKSEESYAPKVVAKGADLVAFKIREIAKENHVEIVENKPLARMLYHNVELGEEIPPELYQSVAEVLAFVYNLKQSRG